MDQRPKLSLLLKGILPNKQTKTYFQPPDNTKMEYPCIVYSFSKLDIKHADNAPYTNKKGYQITVIDPNPDSEISDNVALLPSVSLDRVFVNDNLNHYVYTLYF